MTDTTLCYIEQNGCYLMLHRVKKKNDLNEGKWIGVGGHVEAGESAEDCIRREVTEETGLVLGNVRLRGVVDFISDRWDDEAMYLYTSDDFSGTLAECSEGDLQWIPKNQFFQLPLWEGDRIFLNYLLEERVFFHLRLHYNERDELISSRLLPSIILASASPRRRELLAQIGIDPIVLPSTVEEVMEGVTPEEIVKSLSRQKAEDVAKTFHNGELIIGADTVVAVGNRILGKPHSHEEAAEMIREIAGRTHEVYTGVTVIRAGTQSAYGDAEDRAPAVNVSTSSAPADRAPAAKTSAGSAETSIGAQKSVTFAERTEVRVAPMTDEEILLYAESGEPMDKAGAYAIQGMFAAFIEGISGDYANVVGLPVHRVYKALQDLS